MDFFGRLISSDDLLSFVREDIILKKDVIYFDWTASGLESKTIKTRLDSILPMYANTHSATSKNASFISNLYEQAKNELKNSLDLSEDFYIIPAGFGASGAIKRFEELVGIYISPILKKSGVFEHLKKQVIIGAYEHHSNEISLKEGLTRIFKIPLKNDLMDLDALDSMSISNPIASINIASNASGIIAPYEIISQKLRAKNSLIAFDLAAISPHENVDSNLFDAGFISPHKLLGGIGSCGILCARKNLFNAKLAPSFSGGGSIKYASNNKHFFIDDIQKREDSGTPPILGLLKAALAYQYRNEIGFSFIQKREKILSNILLDELQNIPSLRIYGINNNARKLPIISFNVEGISAFDLAFDLSHIYGIETRAGCACAGPYGIELLDMEEINNLQELELNPNLKPSFLRVSLHYSHNFRDIEYFIDSLKKIIKKRGL